MAVRADQAASAVEPPRNHPYLASLMRARQINFWACLATLVATVAALLAGG
jgi:hypothetical protein